VEATSEPIIQIWPLPLRKTIIPRPKPSRTARRHVDQACDAQGVQAWRRRICETPCRTAIATITDSTLHDISATEWRVAGLVTSGPRQGEHEHQDNKSAHRQPRTGIGGERLFIQADRRVMLLRRGVNIHRSVTCWRHGQSDAHRSGPTTCRRGARPRRRLPRSATGRDPLHGAAREQALWLCPRARLHLHLGDGRRASFIVDPQPLPSNLAPQRSTLTSPPKLAPPCANWWTASGTPRRKPRWSTSTP